MLPKHWETIDEILYLKKQDTAIVSDIHLGSTNINESTDRLFTILSQVNPQRLIINGDLCYLHTTNILQKEYKQKLVNILQRLNETVPELIYLEGNHEMHSELFPDILTNTSVTIDLQYDELDTIVVTHGHKHVDIASENYIIGHAHPRKQGHDVYHYKQGGYKNGDLIIMPAFANAVDGVDINEYDSRCPMLGKDTQTYKHNVV